jgi:hypothetical protein
MLVPEDLADGSQLQAGSPTTAASSSMHHCLQGITGSVLAEARSSSLVRTLDHAGGSGSRGVPLRALR